VRIGLGRAAPAPLGGAFRPELSRMILLAGGWGREVIGRRWLGCLNASVQLPRGNASRGDVNRSSSVEAIEARGGECGTGLSAFALGHRAPFPAGAGWLRERTVAVRKSASVGTYSRPRRPSRRSTMKTAMITSALTSAARREGKENASHAAKQGSSNRTNAWGPGYDQSGARPARFQCRYSQQPTTPPRLQ